MKKKSALPICVQAMGCYCAGHARGNPVSDPCDTSEKAEVKEVGKKVRVWAYQDGVLLPDGFEAEAQPGAEIPCLIALLEGLGVEVCIGNDERYVDGVKEWFDVSEGESEAVLTRRYFDESSSEAKVVAIDQAHGEAIRIDYYSGRAWRQE